MQLIPAIDLRDGRCVRLFQGRFDAETVYSPDPMAILEQYAALGASLVHVVDLDGARAGSQGNADAIAALAASRRAALQVGGGIRSRETVRRLIDAGVTRAVVGSTAVTQPDEVQAWLREFGPEAIVLAFDVRIDERERAAADHSRVGAADRHEPVGCDCRLPASWAPTRAVHGCRP